MFQPVLLEPKGKFPDRPFKPMCGDAWERFFAVTSSDCDLAFWVIEADAATVVLTGRNTTINEDQPEWQAPAPPIIMLVDGVIEALNATSRSGSSRVRADFQSWVIDGILESFTSPNIAKAFRTFLPKQKSFGIVSSPHDEGLVRSDLSLIWSTDKSFSLSTIKTNQAAAKKRITRGTKVRKKRR
jgi:hypothetical protein